jgi:hypothetical protein
MAHPWPTKKDGADAAIAIRDIYNTTGTLPEEMVTAYKKMLKTARPGVIQSFFEALAKECPEALKFFTKPK